MLNPLFKANEAELNVQYDEIRFGIYEIDAFKGKYLNIVTLLSAAQRLPIQSANHESLARRGLARAATAFRLRINHRLQTHAASAPASANEQSPLIVNGQPSETRAEPQPFADVEEQAEKAYENGERLQGPRSYAATATAANVVERMRKPFDVCFRDEIRRVQSIYDESIRKCRDMLTLVEEDLSRRNAQLAQVHSNSYRVELKDIYQQLNQVSQYVSANHMMATRLLHSPVVSNSRFGPKIRSELQQVLKAAFERDERDIQHMIFRAESLFARYFGVGDANVARFELLAYVTSKNPELTSTLAMLLGFVSASVIFTLSFVFFSPLGLQTLEREGLGRIYRGLSLLNMIPWLNLVVVGALRRNRVNYILLFEMDHQTRRYHEVVALAHRACVGTLALIANLIACLVCLYLHYDWLACACPAVMLPLYLAAIYTTPTMQSIGNRSFKTIALNFLGLGAPSFGIVYLADCFTSLAKPMGDIARLCCHVFFWDEWGVVPPDDRFCAVSPVLNKVIIPFLAAYPLWVRMVQSLRESFVRRKSWPHLFNAMKFAFAHQVVIISTLRPNFVSISYFFFFVFVITSFIMFLWDVFMDWGLGRPQYRMLRERLMFRRKAYYYVAIVMDFLLRFTWTLTLVSSGYLDSLAAHAGGWLPSILIPLGPNVPANFLELVRRTFWSVLRIENEHLNNTQHYRSVDFVPLYFYEEAHHALPAKDGDGAGEDERKRKDRRRGFFAALRVILILLAAASFAVWSLGVDEEELVKYENMNTTLLED